MRIQHNITAMNSYRNFATNNSMLGKNLEKLSSGYKVNRAGDDAAGLAISEKMRAQITGLEGATKNAKDGISLIQTAEGALTEVHSMLNRMTTLAEQSANGTYDDSVDRFQLQKEIQALKDEIDRIADSTNFNGLKLLDGSLSSKTAAAANNEMQLMTVKSSRSDAEDAAAVSTAFSAAKGDTYKFTVGTVSKTTFEAFTFVFTGKDGNEHQLSIGTIAGSATTGGASDLAGLIGILNGSSADGVKISGFGEESAAEALRAFRETFDVAANGADALDLTVKEEAAGTARLTNVYGGVGANAAAAWGLATGEGGTKTALATTRTDGMGAGLTLTIEGTMTAGNRIHIGGKVYEFVAAGEKAKTAGATAVAAGTNVQNSTEALLQALKDDGYEVVLEDAANGKIRFTNLEQISESQAGGAVGVSSSNLAVRDQEATKQTTTFTIKSAVSATKGGASTGDPYEGKYDFTISVGYVDTEGKNQSKTLTVITAATSTQAQAEAIKAALQADTELAGLFEFGDADSGSFTITSRSTDNTMNQISTISVSAVPDGTHRTVTEMVSQVDIAAGLNDGKSIELKDGSQNIKAGDTVTINGKTYEFASHSGAKVGEGNTLVLVGVDGVDSLKNLSEAMTKDGFKNSFDAKTGKLVFSDRDNIVEGKSGGLRMQIGDTADSYNQMTVSVEDMHVAAIGIKDVDISTQDGAAAALDLIKQSINYVSDTRGSLGALQNRLDHTINNLGVMRENIQNAESLIRDTDIAEEMMSYTKNSILNQSAQAMLAQANQLPQSVLQLLQ